MPFAVSSEGPRIGVTGHMVSFVKIAKTIPVSRSLTARCAFKKAVDQDIVIILVMCRDGMAGGAEAEMARSGRCDGQPLQDGRGGPVVTFGQVARRYRWFPAGRLEPMASRLRLVVSSRLPVACDLCQRPS